MGDGLGPRKSIKHGENQQTWWFNMAMDQYLYIPFLGRLTSWYDNVTMMVNGYNGDIDGDIISYDG